MQVVSTNYLVNIYKRADCILYIIESAAARKTGKDIWNENYLLLNVLLWNVKMYMPFHFQSGKTTYAHVGVPVAVPYNI